MSWAKKQDQIQNKLYTISQIAKTINGRIDGNPDLAIKGVCDLKNSCSEHLSYIVSEKYETLFQQSKAIAILVGNDCNIDRGNKTIIYVKNPAISFIEIIYSMPNSYIIEPRMQPIQ